MSYNTLVYRIGKRYGQALEQAPETEYPKFIGHFSELLNESEIAELPELSGEYVIGYTNDRGNRHYLRVYFDDNTYEVTGTPMSSDDYRLSTGFHQDQAGD